MQGTEIALANGMARSGARRRRLGMDRLSIKSKLGLLAGFSLLNLAVVGVAGWLGVSHLDVALEEINTLETTRIDRQVYQRFDEHFVRFLLLGAALVALALTLNMNLARRLL